LSDLIPHFQNNGIITDVLLLKGNDTPFKEILLKNNITIFSFGKNTFLYNPFLSIKLINKINKYDIVHVHLFPALYWVAIAKVISFSKVKLISTEHSTNNNRRKLLLLKYIDRFIYNRYLKVICISDKVKESLCTHLQINSDKFVIIYNGIDIEKFIKPKNISRQQLLGIDNCTYLITQVASFREAKDQDTTIRAIALLPDNYMLALVGDGERLSVCKELAVKLGIGNRVFFLGNQEKIPEILQASDIFVMSSHWEGFGIAAIEGMAAGKPIVASDVPGLADIVSGYGVLFKKGNFEQLSQIIDQLISDPIYYKEIAFLCRERAKQFNIIKTVDSYINIYKNL
jgi:glycosyltransferase involved in cell wall biosynthesis